MYYSPRENNQGRTMMIDKRNHKPRYDSTCDRCHEPEPCQNSCYKKPEPCQNSCCKKPEPCHNSCCKEPKKWSALDPTDEHHLADGTVVQDQDATLGSKQQSIESIVVKDSCDIEVSSTDTQAAVNVQAALQIAVAIVISISIADSSQADAVTQDLFAQLQSSQMNTQHVYIENSRGVTITTTDTDIAVNIQILLQILIALVVRLDVL